jgi:hypothetical protein
VPVTFVPADPDAADVPDPIAVGVVEGAFGGPLPDDYRTFLLEHGSFYGDLLLPSGVALETRLFGPAEVLADLGYAVFADVRFTGTIPIGGMSGWRYCLEYQPDGCRYLDVDLVSGDVLHTFSALTFTTFLVELVEHAGAPQSP